MLYTIGCSLPLLYFSFLHSHKTAQKNETSHNIKISECQAVFMLKQAYTSSCCGHEGSGMKKIFVFLDMLLNVRLLLFFLYISLSPSFPDIPFPTLCLPQTDRRMQGNAPIRTLMDRMQFSVTFPTERTSRLNRK